jgi:predicted short-subunit dehydrogenase-like oxidoreductase (DUF2520 family)
LVFLVFLVVNLYIGIRDSLDMLRLCAYPIRVRRPLKVALVGCGRVGTAIALGLKRAGYSIVAVQDTSPSAERRARRLLLPRPLTPNPQPLTPDLVLLATPDSRIVPAWQGLTRTLVPGQAIVHFSGALSSRVFSNAEPRRITALALHPVMTFSGQRRIDSFAGTYFTLEGNPEAIALGHRLVRALGGKAIVLRARGKPLFHAACVMVSNLIVALIDAGLETCASAGIKPRQSARVLEPLINRTLGNIRRSGTGPALTGPVVRGDVATVRCHIAALRRSNPELVPLYLELSRRALSLARRKGGLSPSSVANLRSALGNR